MATYWLTFRIAESSIGGRTYSDRYNALVKAITEKYPLYWGQTTSFLAFDSADSTATIAAKCKQCIAPSEDLFLIRTMDTQSALICGKNNDQDIFKLIPYLKAI